MGEKSDIVERGEEQKVTEKGIEEGGSGKEN